MKKTHSPARYSKRVLRKSRWGGSIRNEVNYDPDLLEKVTGPKDVLWDLPEDQPDPDPPSIRGIN